jgi:hypothetical protein
LAEVRNHTFGIWAGVTFCNLAHHWVNNRCLLVSSLFLQDVALPSIFAWILCDQASGLVIFSLLAIYYWRWLIFVFQSWVGLLHLFLTFYHHLRRGLSRALRVPFNLLILFIPFGVFNCLQRVPSSSFLLLNSYPFLFEFLFSALCEGYRASDFLCKLLNYGLFEIGFEFFLGSEIALLNLFRFTDFKLFLR